jgi:sulfoxide reductase heme-binding subunit YedZ
MSKLKFSTKWIYFIATLPALFLVYRVFSGSLGIDPVKKLEHELGLLTIQFLILTLVISPVRDLFRINLVKYRRSLGLMTFFYAFSHFSVWMLLDIQLLWDELIADILKRPYITFGFLSLLGFIPLALTSNAISIRRFGILPWRRLHSLIYPASFLAGLHFVMVKKVWELESSIYFVIIITLLIFRFVKFVRKT